MTSNADVIGFFYLLLAILVPTAVVLFILVSRKERKEREAQEARDDR